MVDVEALNYFPDSQVCRNCYNTRPPVCFGTYNVTAEECTRLCPDRKVCFAWPELVQVTAFSNKVFQVATQRRAEAKLAAAQARGRERSAAAPFRRGTMIGKFFESACRPGGLPIGELRAVCTEIEASHKDYYRRLYSGFAGGWRWEPELMQVDGAPVLRISNVRQEIKGKGKR